MHAILFDLDGVIYQGDRPIEGAADVIAWIRSEAIPHLFLTNTSSRPRSELCRKLGRMGIAIDPEQILSPPVAAARWLHAQSAGPLALFVPPATQAEFARIGRYYATESMLVWDQATQAYDADATPSYGSETLGAFYTRVLRDGLAGQELGQHKLF